MTAAVTTAPATVEQDTPARPKPKQAWAENKAAPKESAAAARPPAAQGPGRMPAPPAGPAPRVPPPLPPGRLEARHARAALPGQVPESAPVAPGAAPSAAGAAAAPAATAPAAPGPAALGAAVAEGAPAGPVNAPALPVRPTSRMALPDIPAIKDSANEHQSAVAQDPHAAAVAYEELAGKILQTAQRDDIKIQADRRFAVAARAKVEADQLVIKGKGADKKDLKARKEAMARYGLAEAKNPDLAMEEIVRVADGDLARADGSVAHADEGVPLIDGTYEEARRVKTEVKATTGGRSQNYTIDKAQRETGETQLKHMKRVHGFPKAIAQVRDIGGKVREAKLSGDLLSTRVKQFEQHREEALKRGQGGISLAEKTAKIIGGMVIGAATGGIVRPGVKSTDGGFSGDLDYKQGNVFARIKAESVALKALQTSGAYGSATGFHAGLAHVMRFLRELRDFLGGLTIWLGVISVFAPPVAPVAAVVGLMVVALAALRSFIGTVLLSWSLIQRATMSNWRAKNTVNAQAVQQGGELLGDLGQAVAPTAAAAGGGTVGGTAVSSVHQLTHGIGTQAASSIGGTAVNKVTGVVTGAVAPGLASMGVNKAQTDAELRGVATRNTDLRATPGSTRSMFPGTPAPAAAPAKREPAWMTESRGSHAAATAEVTKALVSRHAGKLAEFHAKTQELMSKSGEGVKESKKAETKTSKVEQLKSADNAGRLAEGGEAVGSLNDVVALASAPLARLSRPAELMKDLAAQPAGEPSAAVDS